MPDTVPCSVLQQWTKRQDPHFYGTQYFDHGKEILNDYTYTNFFEKKVFFYELVN